LPLLIRCAARLSSAAMTTFLDRLHPHTNMAQAALNMMTRTAA
jgi:hypothetical protein